MAKKTDTEVKFARLPHGRGLPVPSYATDEAAGIDLTAALHPTAHILIEPGECRAVDTGFAIAIPKGYVGLLVGRSGHAFKLKVTVAHVGTIDSDYRGEIKVLIENRGKKIFKLEHGTRFAQLVVVPVLRAKVTSLTMEEFSRFATARGQGGFGSTGMSVKKK